MQSKFMHLCELDIRLALRLTNEDARSYSNIERVLTVKTQIQCSTRYCLQQWRACLTDMAGMCMSHQAQLTAFVTL